MWLVDVRVHPGCQALQDTPGHGIRAAVLSGGGRLVPGLVDAALCVLSRGAGTRAGQGPGDKSVSECAGLSRILQAHPAELRNVQVHAGDTHLFRHVGHLVFRLPHLRVPGFQTLSPKPETLNPKPYIQVGISNAVLLECAVVNLDPKL